MWGFTDFIVINDHKLNMRWGFGPLFWPNELLLLTNNNKLQLKKQLLDINKPQLSLNKYHMMQKVLYPLFLAGNKRLEPGRHSEPELVNEGRLALTVDLNFDPGFERRVVCRTTRVWNQKSCLCWIQRFFSLRCYNLTTLFPHPSLPRPAGIRPAGCPAWAPVRYPSLPWWWRGGGVRRRLRWRCNTSRSEWRPGTHKRKKKTRRHCSLTFMHLVI